MISFPNISLGEIPFILIIIVMISSSIFLFISYFRLGMSLPILESKLKKYSYGSALNFEKNIRGLTNKDEFDKGIENYNSSK